MGDQDNKSTQNIKNAVLAFEQKKLVAIPTETVYGLAAPIDQTDLIQKIFNLKERPFFDPLIVHVASIEQAKSLTSQWTATAEKIAQRFWPGPLTMVLPKKNHVSDLITSGLNTVGIRFPSHPLTLELIKTLQVPLAAPSANKFKQTSPSQPEHVQSVFSQDDVFVLNGGACSVGIESTIVAVKENTVTILRPGMIHQQDFEKVGIHCTEAKETQSLNAPGMMDDHYMPKKPLFLSTKKDSQIIRNFLKRNNLNTFRYLELPQEPFVAARKLYNCFHQIISEDALICIIQPNWNNDPNWSGILDRLKKASSDTIDLP